MDRAHPAGPLNRKRPGGARLLGWAAALALAVAAAPAAARTYDLVIENGRVMDPETGLDAPRHVGVSGGVIRKISRRPLKGVRRIDAAGLVVAPGFIDLHSHGQNPQAYQLQAQDGVTSALEMEVGTFPVPGWYAHRAGKALINFGAAAGHTACRALAFGAIETADLTGYEYGLPRKAFDRPEWRHREATPAQHAKILACLQQALDHGAVGVGVHLAETPGVSRAQFLDIFRLAARNRVPVHVHMRAAGDMPILDAAAEVIANAEATGAGVQLCHVNSSGMAQTRALLDRLAAARRKGVRISADVYPYTGASTAIGEPHVTKDVIKKLGRGFEVIEWAATGERLTEQTWERYKAQQPTGRIIAHIMNEADVDYAVAHPAVSIGSDNVPYVDGAGHPRSAGAFARVLGRHVREKHALSLMQALAKMTVMPADRLAGSVPQMRVRGRLQRGMVADIVIFDADKVLDKATYQQPAEASSGFAHVLVSGQAVVENYRLRTDLAPGREIRR